VDIMLLPTTYSVFLVASITGLSPVDFSDVFVIFVERQQKRA
jgi:hypothetical protein